MDGAEVLLRWNHPTLGAVSPAEFIPLVETTSLIEPLTMWGLESAPRQSAAWRAAGLDVKLSANVLPGTLAQMDLAAHIAAILDASGVLPDRFELELTEGVLASADIGVRQQMARLRRESISIAIDDFGTGYSNMSSLTQLPADVIKIDKSLVQGIDAEPRQGMLVRAIIDLSHDLGLAVVAEGIETATLYGLLREWGCDEGQGFPYEPLPRRRRPRAVDCRPVMRGPIPMKAARCPSCRPQACADRQDHICPHTRTVPTELIRGGRAGGQTSESPLPH